MDKRNRVLAISALLLAVTFLVAGFGTPKEENGERVLMIQPDHVYTVVDQATGVGTDRSIPFAFGRGLEQPYRNGEYGIYVTVQAIKTGTFTDLSISVQASLDNGQTWEPFYGDTGQRVNLARSAQGLYFTAGALYKLRVDSFVGGSVVTVKIAH